MRQLDRTARSAAIQLDRVGLLGPVPVLQDACGARRAASSSTPRWRTAATGSPSSTPSAGRSWARASAPLRTTSSASWPATAAARSTTRKPASATRAQPLLVPVRGEESDSARADPQPVRQPAVATYRTLCVRLCDGYYFPVSFSTLPNHFQRDCRRCASPVRRARRALLPPKPRRSGRAGDFRRLPAPYTSLKSAFRYRKEYVQGCSCKQAEYKPGPGEESLAPAGNAATRLGVRLGASKELRVCGPGAQCPSAPARHARQARGSGREVWADRHV